MSFQVQLFIGSAECTHDAVMEAVHKLIGSSRHSMMWLKPEKQQYQRSDLDPLFEKGAFSLGEHEKFVFVMKEAELLSTTCANSLLKVLEEPPRGYYYMLMTERPALLLATIRSRCMVHVVGGSPAAQYQELVELLLHPKVEQLALFARRYQELELSDRDVYPLFDELMCAVRASGRITLLAELMKMYQLLPPPGSSQLFWRDLMLKLVLCDRLSVP